MLGFYILLVALATPGLFRLQIDNDVEGFFVRDSEVIRDYQQFERDFGPDRAGRIVLRGSTLWSAPTLAWLAETENALARIGAVAGAAGLYHHHRHSVGQWPPPDLSAFRSKVLSDPLDRAGGFVSPDGKLITILFALYRVSPDQRRDALREVRRLLEQSPPGIEADLAGLPVLVDSIDQAILDWIVGFFPWLIGAAVLLLWLVFGNLAHVLIPLLFVAIIEVLVLGSLGYLGVPVDLISLLGIPLLFVISLATAIHVLVRFRHHLTGSVDPIRTLQSTYREKGWPIFWTGLTTFVAFASVAISDVPPLRKLGISLGVGIGLMTVSMFLLYPLLLVAPRRLSRAFKPGFFERSSRRLGRKLTMQALDRRRWVLSAFLLVALAAGWGLTRLRVQTSVLEYFTAESSERKTHESLQQGGIPPVAIDLILSGRGSNLPFTSAEALQELGRLAREIRSLEPTLGVVSAASLLESVGAGEVGSAPATGSFNWDQALRRASADPDLDRLLSSLMTRSGRRARVSILIPFLGLNEVQPLLERAREASAQHFPSAESLLTGQYLLTIRSQAELLPTMLGSLSLTLFLISLIFLLITRSLRLWLVSLLPNLWPVLLVLGLMGWVGIPLDGTTVAIAAVLMGLAVDDTLHTLGYFRELSLGGARERVAATLERAAGAHILTTTVLAAGFGICGLSNFLPVARFGWLAALGVGMALLADLILFPVLLAMVPGDSNHRAAQ